MGILDMWKEARGAVLKRDYEEIVTRMRDSNSTTRKAYLSKFREITKEYLPFYEAASPTDRKRFLKEMRAASVDLWNDGFWPQAVGIGAAIIHIESCFTPGDDAAQVKAATAELFEQEF